MYIYIYILYIYYILRYIHIHSYIVSFNIETLNSGANPPLQTSFIKFDAAIATFKNLLKMAVLKNKDGHGKGRLKVLSYVPMYT